MGMMLGGKPSIVGWKMMTEHHANTGARTTHTHTHTHTHTQHTAHSLQAESGAIKEEVEDGLHIRIIKQ